ncbi:6-O-methylguanine DNA methyltransferase [Ephemerocybe angulata]|uniref:Methylated-DNA--protein-cysteine methyltransferase n=1 Tax=Ephemerocybe angulata TaxID=980116 RepID=A0A8H6LYA2_9AGAR|nr:6-O-methylguanine DNA methyltransferase [Tulosesus angulatus]
MPPERLELEKFRFMGSLSRNQDDASNRQVTVTQRNTSPSPSKIAVVATPSGTTNTGGVEPIGTQSAVDYPSDNKSRAHYRTSTGKRLTPYQWKVYDYLLTIPRGRITTYKGVAAAVGGSPRSAGTALRNNPFSPQVPCHRVIASDLFIGGFFGEWVKGNGEQPRVDQKRALLADEGVTFDEKGYLLRRGLLL